MWGLLLVLHAAQDPVWYFAADGLRSGAVISKRAQIPVREKQWTFEMLRFYSRGDSEDPAQFTADVSLSSWSAWIRRAGAGARHLPVSRYVRIGEDAVLETRLPGLPPERTILPGSRRDPMLSSSSIPWRIVDLSLRHGARGGTSVGVAFVKLSGPLIYQSVRQAYREVEQRLKPLGIGDLTIVIRGDSWFGGEFGFSGIDYFDDSLDPPSADEIAGRTVYRCNYTICE